MIYRKFILLTNPLTAFSFLWILCLNSCHSASDKTTTEANSISPSTINPPSNSTKINQFLIRMFDSNSTRQLVIDNDTIKERALYCRTYSMHQFKPFWVNEEAITSNANDYINVLKDIRFDGFNEEVLNFSELTKLMNQIKSKNSNEQLLKNFEIKMTRSFLMLTSQMILGSDTLLRRKKDWKNANDLVPDFATILCKTIDNNEVNKAFDLMRPKHRYYKVFRNEYRRLDSIKQSGGWPFIEMPVDSTSKDTSGIWFKKLRKRLFTEKGFPIDTSSPKSSEDLITAIKKFQFSNHIRANGKIDSTTLLKLNVGIATKLHILAFNMERLRWMKHDFPQPYIWVDVAKQELDYIDHDSVKFNMRVVVGKPGRPTPSLDAPLQNIVFSPPWSVPPTIMKEDVLPGIAKRGISYLTRKGLKVFDKKGRVVNTSSINTSNIKQYKIGQSPGYRSSLGEVKFNLPNPWSIYLHDTPHREDFVKFYRAFSSGCIRVHHPKEFAAFLLQDSMKYSYTKIDSICKKRKTVYVPFRRDVMVHIVYLTNAVDSTGQVIYLKDIYKWD